MSFMDPTTALFLLSGPNTMKEKIFYSQLQAPRITTSDSIDMAFLLCTVLKKGDSKGFLINKLRLSAKKHHIYVARHGHKKGHIIGTARMILNYSPIEMGARLEDVALRPEFEGRGIMTALIIEIIKKAKKDGIAHINLTSANHRARAIKLYKKFGFERIDTNVFRLKL